MRREYVFALVLGVALSASATGIRAGWNVLSGTEFTYCYSVETCTGLDEGWILADSGGCTRIASVIGENPFVPCGAGGECKATASLNWQVSGNDQSFDDMAFLANLSAGGTRVGPSTFRLDGTATIVGGGQIELAAFRYGGDNAVFDGMSPESVFDLVDAGIIDRLDVLFVTEPPGNGQDFAYEFEIGAILDDEIVVMTSGAGAHGADVPAGGPLATAALCLAMLGLSSILWRLRRA